MKMEYSAGKSFRCFRSIDPDQAYCACITIIHDLDGVAICNSGSPKLTGKGKSGNSEKYENR